MLLREEPHGLFSWLFLNSCSLPPFFLSVLLFLPSLADWASGFEQLSLLRSDLALQQSRCATRGKLRGRQRRLPRRTAPGGQGHQRLCESTSCSTEPGPDALGWTIWQWSDCGRSGWTGLRHARQGLLSPHSARGASPPGPAFFPADDASMPQEPLAASLTALICN